MRTLGRSLSLRLSAWEADLRARFVRMTQRERFLVMAFGGMVLFAVVFLPFGWAADQREQYARAEAARDEAQGLARRNSPISMGALQTARLTDLEGLSLEADSVSIARILIEQRLAGAAEAAQVELTSVTVGAELEDGPTPLLRAELAAPYAPQTFWTMLDALSRSPEAVFLDSIDVTANQGPAPARLDGSIRPTGQARATFLFPVRITAAEGAPA
ncbi:hypothetical protein [Brevundimonas sp.]|uniref:hypothetical protein n=1 Tax=Brevundimonas sp. TaxID=1871086 RepID=UPI0035B321D8